MMIKISNVTQKTLIIFLSFQSIFACLYTTRKTRKENKENGQKKDLKRSMKFHMHDWTLNGFAKPRDLGHELNAENHCDKPFLKAA